MTPTEAQEALLDCVIDHLDLQEPPFLSTPPRTSIIAGPEAAWDDCCDNGGQVWVRLITAQPVEPLGTYDGRVTKCHPSMGLQVEVGIIRCGETIDEAGHPPSTSALTAEALQVTADMVSLLRAIACCGLRVVLGEWTPMGGGGCIGGTWSAWVSASFAPPEETSP